MLTQSIGRLSAFAGNASVLLRAYIYVRMLGRDGMCRVADIATLNANYLLNRLQAAGFEVAHPEQRMAYEFIVTLKKDAQQLGVGATDIAMRLLDYGYRTAPLYFPTPGSEGLLIEPTETESIEVIDGFLDALGKIKAEAASAPDTVRRAPHALPVKRLDEARAAREPDLRFSERRRT